MLLLSLRGENETISILRRAEELEVRTERYSCSARPPNGLKVHLRGQGPRAEADAAHGVHACESRDAGRAPP